MKKQINPTIKAHLIRGAFYLLLLVAVCAIPFALAQRNKLSSTKAQATKAPPTKAQAAAASGRVFQSGAAGALAGRAPAKPSLGQNALSYDVRTAPLLPRTSQVPLRNIRALAAHAITVPPQPKAPQVVLYDQYDNASINATSSQEFPDFPTFDDFVGDDFVVPGGQTWTVQSIDADGIPFNCSGSCVPDNFNVFFYTNSGSLPGTQVYSA